MRRAGLGRNTSSTSDADPALFVKLLDAGQRLPVHVHPDRAFAVQASRVAPWKDGSLGGARDKRSGAGCLSWLGDATSSRPSYLVWVAQQDTEAMLGLMNRLTVEPGDTVLVPAGTVHAIGAGVFSLELQEPTDFPIMLEVEGFDIDPAGATSGFDRDLAISCVRSGHLATGTVAGDTSGRVAPPRCRRCRGRGGHRGRHSAGGSQALFRAQRVTGGTGSASSHRLPWS